MGTAAIGVVAGLVVVEALVVQPFRIFGAGLTDDVLRFVQLVDLLRAVLWVLVPVLLGLGVFLGTRRPDEEPAGTDPARWLWNMLDTFSEGVVAFDHAGRVAFANQAALSMLGRTALPDGTPMAAFADVPRLRTTVARALLDGTLDSAEVHTLQGGRVLLARAAPCDEGALLLLVDITTERSAIEAREAFLSDAAHELRTPVAGIQLGVEALGMGAIDEPDHGRPLLEGVARHTTRLGRLLEDLLSLARLGSGQELVMEDLVVDDILDDLLDELAPGDRVRVRGVSDAVVRGDALAFHRLLVNLVRNGLAYGERVEVDVQMYGDRLRILVDDDGPGIVPAVREKVFQRFFRTDEGRTRDQGGTGLGLAIVREIVERMDGRVWVEDAAMGGARFVVELRRAARRRHPVTRTDP
jgi:two-component system phosphate regulon sensor histidine kinase PhoR